MAKIRVLDDHIANQIAAGEVVERPSSVVKELVENAIDAGGTRINVTIEEGGLQLIRVADNGSGIEADDVETAFYRHATSKISSGKDLFNIRTLGFRGEALPSVAAVAKVECVTAAGTDGAGRRFCIEGGRVTANEDAASPRGTDILVKELFYNTPARLKYMKTIQTELGHVSDFLYRLALAHPGIAFTLRHNESVLLRTLGNGDLLQVVAAVYGTSLAKGMVLVAGDSLDYTIRGYVSKPDTTRANRTAITTVINGRYIRSFPVSNAVMNAYHTLLPVHRFPLAVLHISMDPSLLDVNVHPAKLEVRFSKETELVQCIEQAVREALGGQALIPLVIRPSAPKPPVVQEQLELYRPDESAASGTASAKREAGPYAADAGDGSADGSIMPARRLDGSGQPPAPSSAQRDSRAAQSRNGSAGSTGLSYGQLERLVQPASAAAAQLPDFPRLEPIGQLHGTYIVAQNGSGLFLIDQHAAHERINYEYYYGKFGIPSEASQELLLPITLDFTPAEAEIMTTKLPLLEQVGVFAEAFGGSSFIVRAYPHWLPSGEEKTVIEEMADWLLHEKKSVDLAKLREKSSTLCSCKASIKANQRLSVQEIERLLDRLAGCSNPYTCPHGRPIVISFSTYELEKLFKRVM